MDVGPVRTATRLRICTTIALSAAGVATLADRLTNGAVVVAYLPLAVVGIPLAAYDASTLRLPNRAVLPLYPTVLTLLAFASAEAGRYAPLGRAVAAACLLFGAFYLVAARGWLGFGDVKLAGALGLWLGYIGWQAVLTGILVGWLLAAGWTVCTVTHRRPRQLVPIGPFLVAGTLAAVLL